MTILKCKMCGGNITITGEAHGICDSCGCEVTLPRIDDDKRAEMYNRGNYFRLMGNFDEAYSAYEHIIADDNRDAEAHWNLMLCRYGILYEYDTRRREYIPTCSRLNPIPVLEDIDYLAALECADEYTKDMYRREAMKIHTVHTECYAISKREEPYDVFISFKDKDEITGTRTKGSVVAQEIYTRLTKEGVRVFYSPESLLAHAGENYEPYIYAALNSAKLMILVGDSREHVEARWVKNEWMRYLSIMDKDSSKTLIPVCVGMNPYNLPPELPPKLQAIEWGKIGIIDVITEKVLDLTGKKKPQPEVTSGKESNTILRRAKQYIENGEMDIALSILNKLVRENPLLAEAHELLLCTKFNVIDINDLLYRSTSAPITEDESFRYALSAGPEELKKELLEFKEKYELKWNYDCGMQQYNEEDYITAKEYFEKAKGHKDAEKYLRKCIEKLNEAKRKQALAAEEQYRAERKQLYKDTVKNIDARVQAKFPDEYAEYIKRENNLHKKTPHGAFFWKMLLVDISLILIGAVGAFIASVMAGNGDAYDASLLIFLMPWANGVIDNSFLTKMSPTLVMYTSFMIWAGAVLLRMVLLGSEPHAYKEFSMKIEWSEFIICIIGGAIAAGIGLVICSIDFFEVILIFFMNLLSIINFICEAIRAAIMVPLGTPWRMALKKYVQYVPRMNAVYEQVRGEIDAEFADVLENDKK